MQATDNLYRRMRQIWDTHICQRNVAVNVTFDQCFYDFTDNNHLQWQKYTDGDIIQKMYDLFVRPCQPFRKAAFITSNVLYGQTGKQISEGDTVEINRTFFNVQKITSSKVVLSTFDKVSCNRTIELEKIGELLPCARLVLQI